MFGKMQVPVNWCVSGHTAVNLLYPWFPLIKLSKETWAKSNIGVYNKERIVLQNDTICILKNIQNSWCHHGVFSFEIINVRFFFLLFQVISKWI